METYICLPWNAPQLNPFSSERSPTRLLKTFSGHLRYLHLYPARNNIRDRLAYALSLKSALRSRRSVLIWSTPSSRISLTSPLTRSSSNPLP